MYASPQVADSRQLPRFVPAEAPEAESTPDAPAAGPSRRSSAFANSHGPAAHGENRRSSIAFAPAPDGGAGVLPPANRRGSVLAGPGPAPNRRASVAAFSRSRSNSRADVGLGAGPPAGAAPRRYSRREVLELKALFDGADHSGGGTPVFADLLAALATAEPHLRRLADGVLERLVAKGTVAGPEDTLTFHQLIYGLYPNLLRYEYEFIFSWTRPRVRERKKTVPLTSDERAEIGEIFALYDTNSDGAISLEEFMGAMRRTGLTEDDLVDCFWEHDLDHDSVISLPEFQDMMALAYSSSEEVERSMANVGVASSIRPPAVF